MPRLDLQALAARVSDRESVDWDEVERSGPTADERRVIHNLRLVESLASVSTSLEIDDVVSEELTTTLAESLAPRRGGDQAPIADGTSWGGLQVREKIGEGGFGEVYRAHDSNLDREVALKLIRRDDVLAAQVLKEGRALARVRHPNVVTVHGAEQHDGRVGLWMELVRGRSLADALDEQGPFGAQEAALLGLDLSRALAAVHAAGLIHRDVKAQNAMREQGGRVVLMDFGAAFEREAPASGETTISGTPLYIAPELYAGGTASVASDIYGLGVLLFHLVTGAFPVQARSIAELRERHAAGRSDLLRDVRPDLPDEFVRVVQRAIDHDPARRFATAGEMEQALARCLGLDAAPAAPSPTTADRARNRFPWYLLALAALALTAVVVMMQIRRDEPATSADAATRTRAVESEPAAPDRPTPAEALPAPAGVVTENRELAVEPETARREPAAAPIERAERVERAATERAAAAAPARELDPAPVPYTIAASMYRRDRANRQDRIESGATLDADDRLWLELTVSREVYVYVVNRDDRGNGYALFPLPALDRQNPIPAGERVQIPGRIAGKPQYWGVSVSGGSEELMILASPERQLQFEAEMAGLERPTPLAAVIDDLGDLPVRGIGAIVPGRVERRPAESAARLFDMADVLVGTGVESVNGVWFKKLTLNNPDSW